ncbi:MAG: DUF4258 domain-containing protein [Anaerolineales bacterium]|nr:DUF4258 domain-containing protein [Anaerolineales bacterium]
MDIELLRKRVKRGNYLVKSHAVQHALKEGFDRRHMVEALLNGEIIEGYPDEKRVLICGQTTILEKSKLYLHVVCEYADPVYVEFVTAYIPDRSLWETLPLRRRKPKR